MRDITAEENSKHYRTRTLHAEQNNRALLDRTEERYRTEQYSIIGQNSRVHTGQNSIVHAGQNRAVYE